MVQSYQLLFCKHFRELEMPFIWANEGWMDDSYLLLLFEFSTVLVQFLSSFMFVE